MPSELITPSKVQSVVKSGFKRMQHYRRARAMFVKEYVGQYYRKEFGITGEEPVNLLFAAIRAIVPHIISRNPVCKISSEYGDEYKQYADLLSLGIDKVNRDMKIKEILRAGAVAAMFAMGIFKVGLSASGSLINLDNTKIDPGQIYISMIDLDDFVIDPTCKNLNESVFFGHRIFPPRQLLLDNDLYDHDLVLQLPNIANKTLGEKRASDITREDSGEIAMDELQDKVSVIELYIPKADAIVTIPDPINGQVFSKYLGLTDFYGPKSGPYTFLSLTPPVEGNPLPVAPVSLYFDLHRAANRIANKTIEQADGQRDVLVAKPTHVDVANDIATATSGDIITSDDPKAVNLVSYGGARKENVSMLSELHAWANYMAGQPDELAGASANPDSATEAHLMYSNAAVTVEDTRDLIYDATAEMSSKVGWYLHTDPLLDIPLAKRKPGGETAHIRLTPEQRVGDWQDFYFTIKPKSMSKLDPAIRAKRLETFFINILPSILNTAMLALQMGMQFNAQKAILIAAEGEGLEDEIEEVLVDPEFQQKIAFRMMFGPAATGKGKATGGMSSAGIMQNGGYPMQRPVPTGQQEFNQQAQLGAADAQSQNFGVL